MPITAAALAFLDEGFKPNQADFSAFIPPPLDALDGQKHPGQCTPTCGCGPQGDDEAWRIWKGLAQERFVGATIYHYLGVALLRRGITAQQWASLYPALIKEGREKVGGGGPVAGNGWSSPLAAPAQVTSPFGVRDGSFHEGVDLATGIGTPVLAPTNLKIIDVGRDDESGNYVQAVAQLPDGSYPLDIVGAPGSPFKNDSTWITSFSHLGSTNVSDGDIVQQGQQIGTAGRSGNVFGPGNSGVLHWRVQWFDDDNTLNAKIDVDPLSLVPAGIIAQGPGVPAPVVDGRVPAILTSKNAGPFGGSQTSGQVVIANNSVVAVAGGNANAGFGVGNQTELGFMTDPLIGGGGP